MKKLRLAQKFNYPIDHVLAARQARYTRPDLWPEISTVTVNIDKPDLKERSIAISLASSHLSNFLKTKHYTFLETMYVDKIDNECRIFTNLTSHKSLLHFEDNAHYKQVQNGENHETIVDIKISIHVKIPLLCALLEKTICKEFKQASVRDQNLMLEYLQTPCRKLETELTV